MAKVKISGLRLRACVIIYCAWTVEGRAMLDVLRVVSLVIFFCIAVDVLTLGASTRWARRVLLGRD